MADLRVSDLQPLEEENLEDVDLLLVSDMSASESKKMTVKAHLQGAVTKIDDKSIPSAKIDFAPETITDPVMVRRTLKGGPDGSIDFETITDDNLAPLCVGESELQPIGTVSIQDDAVTAPKIDASAVDRGLDKASGQIGIANTLATPGLHNGLLLDDQGLVTQTSPLLPSDLPVATEIEIGGVSVPDAGGLDIGPTGEISHQVNIAPGEISGLTYDNHGHIIDAVPLVGDDLPNAEQSEKGAVSVPGPHLEVNGAGELSHSIQPGLVPDAYPKVEVDEAGHVTKGLPLQEDDLPLVPADKITTGPTNSLKFPVNQTLDPEGIPYGDCLALADNSVTARHIKDFTNALLQEENPGTVDEFGQPHFSGRFWYQPSTAQLYVYARGSMRTTWLPVGFGNLAQENLRVGGTYSGMTSKVINVFELGAAEGLKAGEYIPIATDALSGLYLVCVEAGKNVQVDDVIGVEHTVTDWILCLGETAGWIHVDVNDNAADGAESLGELIDVSLNDGTIEFKVENPLGHKLAVQPTTILEDGQVLKFFGSDGLWRNSAVLDCGDWDN